MTNSTTPNTAANGGQILTAALVNEIASKHMGWIVGVGGWHDAMEAIAVDLSAALAVALGGSFIDDGAKPAPVSGAASNEQSSIAIVMANVMFNFAQKRGHTLTEADCEMFDRLRKRCDAAAPDVAAAPAPVSGMPDLSSLQRWEFETYDQGGNWIEPNITGEYVRFADVERLLNPTGETK